MSETVAATGLEDAGTLATLHALNADYIRALVESDIGWYADHLSDDFVCTLGDGRRIDKTQFLQRTAEGPRVSDVRCDDVEVRLYGEVALVQAVTHFTSDGSLASRRYTDVWRVKEGRWQAVAAQITPVVDPQN